MGWIIRDFECTRCGHGWEDMVDTKDQTCTCPECGRKKVKYVLGPTGIAAYSIMDQDRRTEHMKDRSFKHSMEMAAKRVKDGEGP